jgi:tetratricopeptide (TPR) repeat protein
MEMSKRNAPFPATWILVVIAVFLILVTAACSGDKPQITLTTSTPAPLEPTAAAVPTTAQEAPDIEKLLDTAAEYYDQGEYEKAILELEQIVELDPTSIEAFTNLAVSHFDNGDYENAAAAWSAVIELTPDDGAPYYERGMCYYNLKEYERAIEDLTLAIDLAPSADAYRIRGKSYALLEDYEPAIADLSQSIALDPTSDEAYFNRAVSLTKIGKSTDDIKNIIADYGHVLQISEKPELIEQARQSLETLLQNTDDPVLRQQATDALQGISPDTEAPTAGAVPSLADIDVTRAPGHSIGFEGNLAPGGADRFLFLASPGDTVSAGVTSASILRIGIQNAQTREILGVVPSNDNSLVVTIPENALYHIVVEDAGGQGGAYVAAFEASPKVSFALEPDYFMVGRLPEGGLLYYTYSATAGSTLQGNVIPHPDTPLDLVVKILALESQAPLLEVNQAGPGENEQFTLIVPDDDDGKLQTFIVSVKDIDKQKGAYLLAITSSPATGGAPAAGPESIVQTIFDAAQSGDFAALEGLCDPLGENDQDTQMICDLAADPTNREDFNQYFAVGKINGDAKISLDGAQAEVPFLFGPEGDRQETMEMVNRDGQWYLFAF